MKLRTRYVFGLLFCLLLLENVIMYVCAIEIEPYDAFTDGFKYKINSDGKTCTIVKYDSKIYTNIIPSELDGYTVTSIGDRAFKDVDVVSGEVKLPSTIVSIGDEAFKGCTLLTKVKLADGTISIGDSAFSGCTGLETINLDNVQTIGDLAFENCDGFKKTDIVFSDNLKSLGSEVFYDSNIETIEFLSETAPETVSTTFDGYSGKKIIPYNCEDYIGTQWGLSQIRGIEKVGDVDQDGVVNANDAALVLDMYKYETATDIDYKIADVNRDGVINANDAASILDIYKYGI